MSCSAELSMKKSSGLDPRNDGLPDASVVFLKAYNKQG